MTRTSARPAGEGDRDVEREREKLGPEGEEGWASEDLGLGLGSVYINVAGADI